jgi:TetR/AcrR family transcriptional regulator, transcriptional repressor for nem operon
MSKTTRNKIVEKAQQLLWQRGYEGTSLNDLVGEMGLSKGAFFHYYPNKQAVSRQVIDKYVAEQFKAPLEKSLREAASIKAGVLKWIEGFYETYKAQDFRGGCLLGNMALELSDRSEADRETIKGHFLDIENMLASALKPLAEEGRLLVEPRQFARLLLGALEGVTMMAKAHKDHNRASREFQSIGQLIGVMIRD